MKSSRKWRVEIWSTGRMAKFIIKTRSPLAKNFGNGGVKVKFEEAETKKA